MGVSRKSKILLFVITVIFIAVIPLCWCNGVTAEASVSWTEINDANDFLAINSDLTGHYRLTADIDLTGVSLPVLGSTDHPFTGVLDGNAHIVRNFTYNTATSNQGLFSVIGSSGIISDLGIESGYIAAGDYAGLLAGTNQGIIRRCYAKGSVTGARYVGGLVGRNEGSISDSYTAVVVSGQEYIGGLAGSNTGTVNRCYSASDVNATRNCIDFDANDYITIQNTSDYDDILSFTIEAWFQWDNAGTSNVNFLIGKGLEQFELHTGGGSGIGGLRFIPVPSQGGDSYVDRTGDITDPQKWYHVAAVYDYTNCKGKLYIDGNLKTESTINRSENPFAISGAAINIGRRTVEDYPYCFDGRIKDVKLWKESRTGSDIITDMDEYSSSDQTNLIGYWKLDEASGLTAYDSSHIQNNGVISDTGITRIASAIYQGGLVGYSEGIVSNSYYDSDVSGIPDNPIGEPRATLSMKQSNNYGSWNFTDTWGLNEGANNGYPYLKSNTAPVAGFDYALSFGGKDYIDMGINNQLCLGNTFTEEAWIYPTISDTEYHGILGYEAGNPINRAPGIWITNNRIHIGFGTGTEWSATMTNAPVVTSNQWNHIAFVYDGNTCYLYVNGILVLQQDMGKSSCNTPVRMLGMVDNYFVGKIDEVRLWKTALSAATIREWMNKPVTVEHPNILSLAADWQFQEDTGTTVKDINKTAVGDIHGSGTSWEVSNVPQIHYVDYQGSAQIQLTGYDKNGDPLSYEIIQNPSHGTLTGTGSSLNYTHNGDIVTEDYLEYRVSDGVTDSSNTGIIKFVIKKPNAAPPIFLTPGGTVERGDTVALSTPTAGADIYYTIDGSDPTASSNHYTGPISIGAYTVIKAIAIKAGYNNSTSVSASYIIRTHSLSYNTNGGTGAVVPESSYVKSNKITIAGQGSLTKDSYTFQGWNTKSDLSGIDYAAGATLTMGAEDVILYAKWRPVVSAPVVHTQPSSHNVTVGNSVTLFVAATVDDGGSLSYQWQKQVGMNPWSNIEGETGTSIFLGGIALSEDQSRFRCIIINTREGVTKSTISDNAILTVSEPSITGYYLVNTGLDTPIIKNATVANGTGEAAALSKLSTAGYAKLSDNSYVLVTISWGFTESYHCSVPGVKAVSGTVTGSFPGGLIPITLSGSIHVLEAPTSTNTPNQNSEQLPGTEQITAGIKSGSSEDSVSQLVIDRSDDGSGWKSDRVTYPEEKATETINKLKETGDDTAVLVIPDEKNEVNKTIINLPQDTLKVLAEGEINLQIETAEAKIELPKEALKNTSDQSKEELYFKLKPVTEEKLIDEVSERAILKAGLIIDNENRAKVVGVPITIETNMPSSDVYITLPITGVELPSDPMEREDYLKRMAVYIEHSNGDTEILVGDIVEYAKGVPGIRFHITRFSIFTIIQSNVIMKSSECEVIAIKEPSVTDISGTGIRISVADTVNSINLNAEVSPRAVYALFRDKACTKAISNNDIKVKTGYNIYYLRVMAEDGATKLYTITINKLKSSQAEIVHLQLPRKVYSKGNNRITAVSYDTKQITVKAAVSKKATWKLYSDRTCTKQISERQMKLKVGENTVFLKVTAEDGITNNVYCINMKREKPQYDTHVRLGLVGSNTYAKELAGIYQKNYDCTNVVVKREGKYSRVYFDFTSRAAARAACKDMIAKKYIQNYYFYTK